MNRLEYLDFLRGIAIILVLLTHTHHFFPFELFNNWSGIGARGVQLFYIVSGFTIFYIYKDKINTIYDVKQYMIKRSFRVLPLYFLILPIYFVTFDIYNNYEYRMLNLITHYFLINGFFPDFFNSILRVEWSIFVEFMFYIIFVYLFYIYRNLGILKIFIGSLLISIITVIISVTYFIDHSEVRAYLYLSPYFQLYNFFLGGYIASISNIPKFFKSKNLLFLIIGIFILIGFFIKSTILQTYLSSVLFGLLILNMKFNMYTYPKLITNIGIISYSVYLVHYFFIMMYGQYITHSLFNFIMLIIIIFFVSTITYYYIELKGINIGKGIGKRL